MTTRLRIIIPGFLFVLRFMQRQGPPPNLFINGMHQMQLATEVITMAMKIAMKWTDRADVTQTAWAVRRSMQEKGDLPLSLVGEVKDLIDHSDPELVKQFWTEIGRVDKEAMKYLEERI